MPLGLLDLSVVTDRLIGLLENYRDTYLLWNPNGLPANPGPPYTIRVTGLPPDSVRDDGDCQLSLYLFHISQDKFQKNSPVLGSKAPPLPAQPMSLDLYYMLSAYAKNDYIREQQAMSIGLKRFYENPFIRTTVLLEGQSVREEFCLTMEVETSDELGRLWQATTVPYRLSTVFKASVVFMMPPPPPPVAFPPTRWTVTVNPVASELGGLARLFGSLASFNYVNRSGNPQNIQFSPAVAGAGQRFLVYGAGLDNPTTANQLFLVPPSGVEQEVTSWLQNRDVTHLALRVPGVNPPDPGLYQLRVGNGPTLRSNNTPLSIAPVVNPGGGPMLNSPYILNGTGFITGQTAILLNNIALTETNAAPGAGQFRVNNPGQVEFKLPGAIDPGNYAVRVLVNGIEALPAKWVLV